MRRGYGLVSSHDILAFGLSQPLKLHLNFDYNVCFIKGLNVSGTVPVSLSVDLTYEPDVREHERPVDIHGTATVHGLTKGETYKLYRYASTAALPAGPPFENNAESVHTFLAKGPMYVYEDPKTFSSHSATYYIAAPTK